MAKAKVAIIAVYVALWVVLGCASVVIALDPGNPLVFVAAGVSFFGVMWLSAKLDV